MTRTTIASVASQLVLAILLLASGGDALGQTTHAADVTNVSALTTSAAETYSTALGATTLMPGTSLTINLKNDSLMVVSFSARGSVQPSSGSQIPIVFIKCQVDGQPCEPNVNQVEFLYPQYCCDTRSFTWAAHKVNKGAHKVSILWGMGNPTSAIVTNRTLVVTAAKLPKGRGRK
jgi:hypothetical protein